MSRNLSVVFATAFTACCCALPAQEPAHTLADGEQFLVKGIQKMLAHGRGHFVTAETQDQSFMRRAGLGGMIGGEGPEVEGAWNGDLLFVEVLDQGRQLALHKGRVLARSGDAWKLRRGTLKGGAPIPHVFEPQLFFTYLEQLPEAARKVRSVERRTWRQREVLVVGFTLEEEQGGDANASGIFPQVSSPMMRIMGGGPGGMFGGNTEDPETTVDLALYVDIENGDVLRLRIKTYRESSLPGNIQIQVAGAAVGGDDEEEVEEGGELVYKAGLPKRKLGKDQSLMYLDVKFEKLGEAPENSLSQQACQLLGIPFKG